MLMAVACFDISDDRNRRMVSRRLEQVGTRVQRSVFEVVLGSPVELEALRQELLPWLEEPEDDIRFYPLCRDCRGRARDCAGERVALTPAAVMA